MWTEPRRRVCSSASSMRRCIIGFGFCLGGRGRAEGRGGYQARPAYPSLRAGWVSFLLSDVSGACGGQGRGGRGAPLSWPLPLPRGGTKS